MGYRVLKKYVLRGTVFSASGEFKPVKLKGPATHGQWEGCYAVWRTAGISWEMLTLGTLELYRTTIKDYVDRYTEQA